VHLNSRTDESTPRRVVKAKQDLDDLPKSWQGFSLALSAFSINESETLAVPPDEG